MVPSDEQTIEMIHRNDFETLHEFVCRPMLMHILKGFARTDLFEDLCSEAFILLKTSILPCIDKHRAKVKPYIYNALRNLVISYISKWGKTQEQLSQDIMDTYPDSVIMENTYEDNEGLTSFVLGCTPEPYQPIVQILVGDWFSLASRRREVTRTVLALFNVDAKIARWSIDLTIMLCRIYLYEEFGQPCIKNEVYPNPYKHVASLITNQEKANELFVAMTGLGMF